MVQPPQINIVYHRNAVYFTTSDTFVVPRKTQGNLDKIIYTIILLQSLIFLVRLYGHIHVVEYSDL